MFVRESKYQDMRIRALTAEMRYEHAVDAYNKLSRKWGKLVDRVNALGGEQFLLRGEAKQNQSQFAAEDVQRLLQLCHPDKHDGKPMATEMTAKLLKLKEQLK